MTATKLFPFPSKSARYSAPQRIDFDAWQLIAPTAVISDGATISSYFLEPQQYGPPYDHIELDLDGTGFFAGGPQRAVSIAGLWGYSNDEAAATTLAAAISTASVTTVTVTTPAGDVGSTLRIDTERLTITEKNWSTSGQLALNALSVSNADSLITVTTGSSFTINETILIDGERMLVQDISGNVLSVRRATGGSTLAAHLINAPVSWQHILVVTRGALGTTAATHLINAPVLRWQPPSGVSELALAYAEDHMLQAGSGYARVTGAGDGVQLPVTGRGIRDLEARMKRLYGRGARLRSV